MTTSAAKKLPTPKPHYFGHRDRLRERLFGHGPDALQDYELLELLLFTAIPRRDVKPMAKSLLNECKDLWSLLNAKHDRLIAAGLSEVAASSLLATGAVALRAHKNTANYRAGPLIRIFTHSPYQK
jgi:DNA repair protein RadC